MSTTHTQQELEELGLRARAAGFTDWLRAYPERAMIRTLSVPHPEHRNVFTDVPDASSQVACKVIELWAEAVFRKRGDFEGMATYVNAEGALTVRAVFTSRPDIEATASTRADALLSAVEAL